MFTYAPGVYNPPNGFYTQLDVYLNESEMRQLIGKNGCNFKYLTNMMQLQYIWWNKKSNIIEIWGKTYDLIAAKSYIQKYINNFSFAPPLQRSNAATQQQLVFMTRHLS